MYHYRRILMALLMALAVSVCGSRALLHSLQRDTVVVIAIDDPINVNHCDADTLCLLRGIGPGLSKRIVDDRDRVGPFASLDDIQRVAGIGPKTAAKMDGYVVFGGGVIE